jgi:hypothetical protein
VTEAQAVELLELAETVVAPVERLVELGVVTDEGLEPTINPEIACRLASDGLAQLLVLRLAFLPTGGDEREGTTQLPILQHIPDDGVVPLGPEENDSAGHETASLVDTPGLKRCS